MYHGCEIVFDSSEVPEQAVAEASDIPDVQVSQCIDPAVFDTYAVKHAIPAHGSCM